MRRAVDGGFLSEGERAMPMGKLAGAVEAGIVITAIAANQRNAHCLFFGGGDGSIARAIATIEGIVPGMEAIICERAMPVLGAMVLSPDTPELVSV